MDDQCPRMTQAAKEGRAIEEGCIIEMELATALKDAGRYRWLRTLPPGFSIRMNIGHDWELLAEEDLDAVIDQAIFK